MRARSSPPVPNASPTETVILAGYVRAGVGRAACPNNMSYTVYVLRDDTGLFYKGFTNNLERRVREHRQGHTQSTKKLKNLVVVYIEVYDTFSEARAREKYLKSAVGRRFLKSKIK